jgi:hypothetical protein
MLDTFWIIVRKGPNPSDEKWYLDQLRQHFVGKLPAPERLNMIADTSVDISDTNYHAALLVTISNKWGVNSTDGKATITNYSDKDGFSGFVISWKRTSDIKGFNYRELTTAAYKGDVKSIESLLAQGANIDGKDENGDTALVRASREGRTETVRYILSKGADVNLADRCFTTPLIHAACSGWFDIVEMLCNNGADVSAKDNTGKTAEEWAALAHEDRIKEFLKSKHIVEGEHCDVTARSTRFRENDSPKREETRVARKWWEFWK